VTQKLAFELRGFAAQALIVVIITLLNRFLPSILQTTPG